MGSNIALVLLCAGLIVAEWLTVTARERENIGKENRFLTTEWYLLQQLRKQTDAELAEKNVEIDRLKRLYEDLKVQDNSSATLAEVGAKLKAAEAERGTMLVDGAKSGLRLTPPSADEAAPVAGLGSDHLMKQRVQVLEEQANALQARAETAEAAVAALKRQVAAHESPTPPAVGDAVSLTRVMNALDRAKAVAPPASPTVAELKTKALTRAILNSSDVKRQYPRLLDEFDQYLEAYGTREYSRGRLTGLTDSAEAVRALSR